MAIQIRDLLPHEVDYLIEAVRRDMRHELERAGTDHEWAEVHRMNARHDVTLLEVLNPKHAAPSPTHLDHDVTLRCASFGALPVHLPEIH